ncbi:MAG: hypothetical protein KME12_24790 [Trichocoleus desertorum ATA4-8-CV12]|nr:hypothetical protein [Trichocoleus desertorum ATA4-8-CV12]
MPKTSVPGNSRNELYGKKLTGLPRGLLVSAHLVAGTLWFATSLCMVFITSNNLKTQNGDALYAINSMVKLVDEFVLIPAAIASVITGTLLCKLTTWGFFKYHWVSVKWIATTSLIIFGTFWIGPWTNAMTAISDTERIKSFANPLFMFNLKGVIIGGAIQASCLLAIIVISIIKPWGRRQYGSKRRQ